MYLSIHSGYTVVGAYNVVGPQLNIILEKNSTLPAAKNLHFKLFW